MDQTDKILETDNFRTIIDVCQDAMINKYLVAIVGDPGYGKTTAFEAFQIKNPETVYYVRVQKSLNAKELFSLIYNEIGSEYYNPSSTISQLIRRTANKFTETLLNKLLIIDEAGKFNAGMLEYVHEFRDMTQKTTGIILGGPEYFKTRLKDWKNSNRPGIPEVYSRINFWVDLEPPTYNEKVEIARVNGINDNKFFKMLDKDCHDFRAVQNKIKIALLSLQKMQNKWK
ncbi:MAG: ATP-binding protein [Bacteroidota bacterium]|nr:ATP-binding protein [Bacteroidota bacterium]